MAEEKKGFFKRLVSGLAKTRDNIVAGFDSIFSGFSSIDEDFYEELEEILIMGDIGINATTSIIENLKKEVSERHIKEPMECKQLLINEIKDQMRVDSTEYEFENRRSVVLVIGVNGVGKTTSVGKLAGKLKDQGKKVILAAADTFRAAAGEQLLSGRTVQVWRSSADRREQILHLLSMMRWQQPKQEMQTYFSAIQQDVFIIKRTLWKNSARFTGSWRGSIRMHIWRHW